MIVSLLLKLKRSITNRESVKEQLLKLVDKQRLRKTVGNFVPKNETELHLDEIIKHVSIHAPYSIDYFCLFMMTKGPFLLTHCTFLMLY